MLPANQTAESSVRRFQNIQTAAVARALAPARLTADAARTFVERAFRVIRAGRPPCPLCGNPLDATGHICPRKNGHYVH